MCGAQNDGRKKTRLWRVLCGRLRGLEAAVSLEVLHAASDGDDGCLLCVQRDLGLAFLRVADNAQAAFHEWEEPTDLDRFAIHNNPEHTAFWRDSRVAEVEHDDVSGENARSHQIVRNRVVREINWRTAEAGYRATVKQVRYAVINIERNTAVSEVRPYSNDSDCHVFVLRNLGETVEFPDEAVRISCVRCRIIIQRGSLCTYFCKQGQVKSA